ncbi:MAG: ABC transporter permease [Planctomycetota bacterium]|jgi:ABC-type nitrate/sulfonate/bicarbonate transport system permease component|nr:ABC transporter permease [Planctomycetota bacterium]
MMNLEEKKKSGLELFLYWGLPILAILLVVGGWLWFAISNPRLMPNPLQVYERLIRTFTRPVAKVNLFGHAFASLGRVLMALVFAWVIGIVLGILIGWSRVCKAVIGTIFEIIRPIPPIAWIPIVIMWFGIEEFPKVLLVFIGTFVPLVINTAAGIGLVDKINIDVGKIFGGNRFQILAQIVIPTALPSIFAGIRTSVSSGWTTVLAAEMIAAQHGLGALVTRGWQGSDMALVMVAVITIAIIGAFLAFSLNKLEKWVCPWTK